jgi:hypothetical protein
VGTVLALVALGFVLHPLFTEHAPAPTTPDPAKDVERSERERAIAALREVEFDRETGKLSESDYTALKTRYTREVLAALRAEEVSPETVVPDDEVEAVILAYRARHGECETCGPRPEPDAIYCSSCGHFLAGACGRCGAAVNEPAARFCSVCGGTLAA